MSKKTATGPVRLRERIASRRHRECAVRWCHERTVGLSSYCIPHRDKKRQTGDPEGHTLLRSHVRRHAAAVRRYLLQHRGHEAVEAGLSWADRWLGWGRSYGNDWTGLDARKQARQYLHRLRLCGVHEADVLATLTALVFIREYEPGSLRSEIHYRFQSVVHVLGLAPWPSEDRGGMRQRYFRPTPRAVEVLWSTIPAPVLVLAHSIAAKIDEEQSGPSADTAALRQPLPTT